jgi:hypothetical protein
MPARRVNRITSLPKGEVTPMSKIACRAILIALYMILTGALVLKLGGVFEPAPEPIQIEHGEWPAAPTGTPTQGV